MNCKRRLLILQIGFAKVLAYDLSRAQFVLPTAQFSFAIYAQDDERVMMRGPCSQLRVSRVAQHESRERVAGLHRTLRARQVQPREDVQLERFLKHWRSPFRALRRFVGGLQANSRRP